MERASPSVLMYAAIWAAIVFHCALQAILE
jgi:hypothetical protein